MIITDKIRAILEQMSGVETVLYDSAWSTNVRIDRRPTPAALLYMLSDWDIDISSGTAREEAQIQVFFFDRAKLDQTGEEKDLIVSQMETLAREFITIVLGDKSMIVKEDAIKLRSCMGRFDAFCVGVTVEMTLAMKHGSCIENNTDDNGTTIF